MTPPAFQHAVEEAFREEWGRVVATLIRRTGDWNLAEECAQDAFAEAVQRWSVDGIPRRPGAWLTTVAGNRAIDRQRRAARGAELLEQVRQATTQTETDDEAMRELLDESDEIPDDRLRLIFTCCHPALALEGRVALTLRPTSVRSRWRHPTWSAGICSAGSERSEPAPSGMTAHTRDQTDGAVAPSRCRTPANPLATNPSGPLPRP